MLGKAAQNPQDDDFEEGEVSAGGNVPTRLGSGGRLIKLK